jgi:tol-pal system protein YbgF
MQVMRSNSLRTGLKVAAFAATVFCAALPAQAAPSVQERLDTLERKVDARGLIDLSSRVEQLQRDLEQLRGDVEVQSYSLEELQRSQREQYLDIDRRLRLLEPAGGAPPAVMSPDGTMPPAGMAPPADIPPSEDMLPLEVPPPSEYDNTAAPPPAQEFDFSPYDSEVAPPVYPGPPGSPATENEFAPPVYPAPPGSAATENEFAPAGGVAAPAPASNPQDEKAEYDTALAILRDGRYSDAALAFKQLIASHPDGSYTDNAWYWLGETYYVTRDFDQAQAAFREVMTRFPQSAKLADSRLKLGFIYYEKQDWKAARTELEAVVNGWPASTAARLASERLARMKQERH